MTHHRDDNEDENWLSVLDWEGLYEVSDLGHVWSERSSKILTPRPYVGGYVQVALYREGERKERPVHHLVLEAFVGRCPEGQESFHENDVSWDNRLTNLKWDTHLENMKHARTTRRLTMRERIELIKQGH